MRLLRDPSVESRIGFNYDVDFYDIVDSLIWPAVHYIDGPMRPYMETDPMFARFCENVENFEALFKANTSFVGHKGHSKGTPSFIRHYLHRQMKRDLDWLDTEFWRSTYRSLECSLLLGNLDPLWFRVGIVFSLTIHLLQLIPLYGPTDGPDNGFYPGKTDHASRDNDRGIKYRSSELVTKRVGHELRFLWTEEEDQGANCRSPSPMNPWWLDFRHEAATSSIFDPPEEKDPMAHDSCIMSKYKPYRTSVPIAHSELYKLRVSRNTYDAKKWKALYQNYSKGRRGAVNGWYPTLP
ncbi:hypothetical protein F4679DRAFT_88617 [Xylaria curta]|nr:hypothetical protein F4679DRAFT_88617 [Xylaria curta]